MGFITFHQRRPDVLGAMLKGGAQKKRLLTSYRVDSLVEDLGRSSDEATQERLITDILLLQLENILRTAPTDPAPASAGDGDGDESSHTVLPSALNAGTTVATVLDSRMAMVLKGWMFRALEAEVTTSDVLQSNVSELAQRVQHARAQPQATAIPPLAP